MVRVRARVRVRVWVRPPSLRGSRLQQQLEEEVVVVVEEEEEEQRWRRGEYLGEHRKASGFRYFEIANVLGFCQSVDWVSSISVFLGGINGSVTGTLTVTIVYQPVDHL